MPRIAWLALLAVLVAAPLAAGGDEPAPGERQLAPGPALTPAQALEKARVGGRYRMLLRQIQVADDLAAYGPFRDWGPWSGTSYRGHEDLPPGHWVYVHPWWYVWRDLAAQAPDRPWGPERAAGAPDTPEAGDRETAWASRTADGDDEWLLLEYEAPVRPIAVLVYESFRPGALVKVTAFRLTGEEVVVWEGVDPTPSTADGGVSVLPVRVDFEVARIRLHVASTRVEGWNEIDAVGLLDGAANVHWATCAHASSFYGDVVGSPPPDVAPWPPVPLPRPSDASGFPRPVIRPVPTPPVGWTPIPWEPAADAGDERLRGLEEALRRIEARLDALAREVARWTAREQGGR